MSEKIKGYMDLTKVDVKNGFRLIRELIVKVEKDSLNIKKEEILGVLDLIDSLDGRVEKEKEDINKKWNFAQGIFTQSQKVKAIQEFTSKEDLDKLLENL